MKTLLDNNKKHYSTSDWDFSTTAWQLNATEYISPPTSLRETIGSTLYVLCKYAGTTPIPQGEIRTWLRPNFRAGRWNRLMFRNQSPIGTALSPDMYYVEFTSVGTSLFETYAASTILIGTFPYLITRFVWAHLRARFTVPTSGDHAGELAVEFYVEEAGEWVKKGDTLYAPNNYYADSAINRLGIRLCYISFADDTEIWKKG